MTAELEERIRGAIRTQVSPRHIPDAIYVIPEVPRTLNGKKLEVPIRRILMGIDPEQSVDPNAMLNPHALDIFLKWAVAWAVPPEPSQ
jgi:acetoacetyl-CoA synthetase